MSWIFFLDQKNHLFPPKNHALFRGERVSHFYKINNAKHYLMSKWSIPYFFAPNWQCLPMVENCPRCQIFVFTQVSNCPVSNCLRRQIVYGVKLSGVKLFVFTHGVKLSGVKLSAVLNCPPTNLGYLCRSTPPALLRLCLRGRSVHPVAGSSPLSRSSGTAPALLMLPTFTRPFTYILCYSLFQNNRFFLYVKQFDWYIPLQD